MAKKEIVCSKCKEKFKVSRFSSAKLCSKCKPKKAGSALKVLKPKKIEILEDDGFDYEIDKAIKKHDLGGDDTVRIDLGDGTSLVIWASEMAAVCHFRNDYIKEAKEKKYESMEIKQENITESKGEQKVQSTEAKTPEDGKTDGTKGA